MADIRFGSRPGQPRGQGGALRSGRRDASAAACVRDGSPDKAADADALTRDILAASGCAEADSPPDPGHGIRPRSRPPSPTRATTEITCHAAGVAALHPEARTVIDIGGQDSKAIRLSADGGRVHDFAMNDRCAAGSGRFLEVAARILGTDVDGLSDLAGRASAESEVSSMCVVFAESEVIGMLARGIAREDIAAGILRSIARRVAGLAERIGVRPPVAFTGGVALNEAMVRGPRPGAPREADHSRRSADHGRARAPLLAARNLGLRDASRTSRSSKGLPGAGVSPGRRPSPRTPTARRRASPAARGHPAAIAEPGIRRPRPHPAGG